MDVDLLAEDDSRSYIPELLSRNPTFRKRYHAAHSRSISPSSSTFSDRKSCTPWTRDGPTDPLNPHVWLAMILPTVSIGDHTFSHCWLRSRSAISAFVFLLLVAVTPKVSVAQELNCSVNVDTRQLSGSDFQYLDELEIRIREYLNERSWTDDRVQPNERIDCSFEIFIDEAQGIGEFSSQLVVAARRPIYNTAQKTPTLRVRDSWTFPYSRGATLVYEPDRFDPLTSVLDFYAYLILGYDYDTFSPLGGTPYFQEARQIVDLASSQNASGWRRLGDDQTRSALVSELLRSRLRPLREVIYEYHLNGLDRFVTDTEAARETMIEQVEVLQSLSQDITRSYAIDLFFAAKFEELAAAFRNSQLRSRAYNLLTSVDPAHSSTYSELVN